MTAILSAAAEDDLEDIGRYTIERWGIDQATTYLRQLLELIEAIGDDMRVATSTKLSVAGMRRYRVGSHHVFARQRGTDVEIVRVLHERMDHSAHLPPA